MSQIPPRNSQITPHAPAVIGFFPEGKALLCLIMREQALIMVHWIKDWNDHLQIARAWDHLWSSLTIHSVPPPPTSNPNCGCPGTWKSSMMMTISFGPSSEILILILQRASNRTSGHPGTPGDTQLSWASGASPAEKIRRRALAHLHIAPTESGGSCYAGSAAG